MFSKVIALAAVAGMASAFVPAAPVAGVTKSSNALKMSFENELGAQPPLGFFDPLGMLSDVDEFRFNRLRYVEIKHGRIAMLAILGHIVTTAGVRLPGYLSTSENIKFEDVPNGLAALSKIPAYGLAQIVGFIGVLELGVMVQREGSFPGDMTNPAPPAAWDALSEKTQMQKRAIELNNGRAAQMGILGLMVHEKLNNDPYVINSLLGLPVSFN
mmetsp:Transcript_11985/g.17661  ORF Transcript_11985/g.17661 Transcript_11985/m.17661 type:complete len:214 (-) Transcript_11985:469-1110(-)|eukprot:CAMPEP_0113935860 /NCGR_PEP_ID=MMETSP1339-20121228/2909_1 /TAXON_ID=94617 /ORGANISM="Fibrocapsa japonica" /LENGTH=213 /DNA_ID=CAMNT_0000938147 /DNA_START=107 /DNA_END=748 /DNA_ORIENTATION=- /assembly_acc=CAM_ASM_000762